MAKSTGTPTENSGYELNTDSVTGKGRPTPTRKEREAANLRPLVSSDRKTAGQASKAQVASERQRARIGLANGEEKYLPARDKGPQRRFIRDYVDARFSVGEILIPVMFVVIILTFIQNPVFQVVSVYGLWIFFGLAVIDVLVAGQLIQSKLIKKYGREKLQRGNRWYTAMRALQLRLMRLPKPQVKRWQFPQ